MLSTIPESLSSDRVYDTYKDYLQGTLGMGSGSSFYAESHAYPTVDLSRMLPFKDVSPFALPTSTHHFNLHTSLLNTTALDDISVNWALSRCLDGVFNQGQCSSCYASVVSDLVSAESCLRPAKSFNEEEQKRLHQLVNGVVVLQRVRPASSVGFPNPAVTAMITWEMFLNPTSTMMNFLISQNKSMEKVLLKFDKRQSVKTESIEEFLYMMDCDATVQEDLDDIDQAVNYRDHILTKLVKCLKDFEGNEYKRTSLSHKQGSSPKPPLTLVRTFYKVHKLSVAEVESLPLSSVLHPKMAFYDSLVHSMWMRSNGVGLSVQEQLNYSKYGCHGGNVVDMLGFVTSQQKHSCSPADYIYRGITERKASFKGQQVKFKHISDPTPVADRFGQTEAFAKEYGCHDREKSRNIHSGKVDPLNTVVRLVGSEASLKAALLYGPVGVSIDATDSAFMDLNTRHYAADKCDETTTSHAVVLTGYAVEMVNGVETPVWILKNSFGPNWGHEGYFTMPIAPVGPNKVHACGIYKRPVMILSSAVLHAYTDIVTRGERIKGRTKVENNSFQNSPQLSERRRLVSVEENCLFTKSTAQTPSSQEELALMEQAKLNCLLNTVNMNGSKKNVLATSSIKKPAVDLPDLYNNQITHQFTN